MREAFAVALGNMIESANLDDLQELADTFGKLQEYCRQRRLMRLTTHPYIANEVALIYSKLPDWAKWQANEDGDADASPFYFRLHPSKVDLSGFEALDFRRKFGLRESEYAFTHHAYGGLRVAVDENYAREWFGGRFSAEKYVNVGLLRPGELVELREFKDHIGLSPHMTLGRAKQLFEAST